MSSRSPDSVLREVFAYPAFRGFQQEDMAAVVGRRDVLVLMSASRGMSRCGPDAGLSFLSSEIGNDGFSLTRPV